MPTILRGRDSFDTANPYVTERGSNLNGHYEIWSDGFIRQWGRLSINFEDGTSQGNHTLPISFNNPDEASSFIGWGTSVTAFVSCGCVVQGNKLAWAVKATTGSTRSVSWQAQGY